MFKKTIRKFLTPFLPKPEQVLQQKIIQEVERAFSNPLSNFPNEIHLPENYGKGLPERVVELYLVGLSYQSGLKILDIGYANAMTCHLNLLQKLPIPKNLVGIDIACPSYNAYAYYQSLTFGDIVTAPFRQATFDLIWCISTLEHIGMDNSGYTDNFHHETEMDKQAVKNMVTLLKQGGSLLITVPFGKYEEHGWLRNYSDEYLHNILNPVKMLVKTQTCFFQHTFGKGWVVVTPQTLQYVGYYNQSNSGAGGLATIFLTKL